MNKRKLALGLGLGATLATLGLLAGTHTGLVGGKQGLRFAGLPATATTPYATGCRDAAGDRGPCDRNAGYCQTDITITATIPATTTVLGNYVIDRAGGTAPGCDIDGQPRTDTNPEPGCRVNSIPDIGADEYYAAGCEPLGQLASTDYLATTTAPTTTPTSSPATTTQPATTTVLQNPAPPVTRRIYYVAIAWGPPLPVAPVSLWYVYLNGTLKAKLASSKRSWTVKVACGQQVTVGVAAYNAAGLTAPVTQTYLPHC